jgi:thiol-disulfide isomerase/thioredoxin
MKIKVAIAFLAVIVLAAILVVETEVPPPAKSILGQKGPEFVVEKWLTPEPVRAGKFVLVDFWATWCPPCRETIPKLNALQKQFPDKLVVIGVSDEAEGKVRGFKDVPIEYASAIDPGSRMATALEIKAIPHVILTDPQGIVRYEGFPLEPGHELTPAMVSNLVAKYSN